MKQILWKPAMHILAGTTLRDPAQKECFDLALHTNHNADSILENRTVLANTLDTKASDWVFAKQTHSDHIYKVESKDKGKGAFAFNDGIDDCDALYTRESDIGIGVFHADCVAVLLYDPYTNIIAAIHSGWQGSVKEITRKCVERLSQQEGVDHSHLLAYISCAIGFKSFEVGNEVVDQIASMSFDTARFIQRISKEKALIDNKGLNEQMLINCGVRKENITVNPNDTFFDNDAFFSYRRDKQCGRHLSYILRKSV